MYCHPVRLKKTLIVLLAAAVVWGTLFTGFSSFGANSQAVYAAQEEESGAEVPDKSTEGDAPAETEAPAPPPDARLLLAESGATAILIEDFEDISDITASGASAVPGSIQLERNARPGPVQYGRHSGKLSYDFTGMPGTSAAYLHFSGSAGPGRELDGYPEKIGMWVYGDGSGRWLRGQLGDNAGTLSVIDFTTTTGFNWNGWRYVTANVPSGLQQPIKLRQIYFAELNLGNKSGGTVYFDQLSAIYTSANPFAIEIAGLAGMAVGDSIQAQVLATVINAGQLSDMTSSATFDSSNPEVAAVGSSGSVQALSAGTAVITASYNGLQAAYTLTVGETAAGVAAIELEGRTHMEAGETNTVKLLAFHEGNAEPVVISTGAQFESSDPAVAAVTDGGIVTAVGAGSTTITALYQGQSYAYTLHVSEPAAVLQSIRIADLTPLASGEAKQLRLLARYSLLGEELEEVDITSEAAYTSSNETVGAVSQEGLVSALVAGTSTIRASFEGKIYDYLLIVHSSPPLPKRELRAAWIASVENIDWPARGVTGEAEQKEAFVALLDELESAGMNAVIVQIKPTADAFYPSDYAPWSEWLTGVQGQAPGYDPLAFMIEEVHKRNMEFHAWFNPYRISMHDNLNRLVEDHPARQNAGWVESYGGKLYFNPGVPEAKAFVIDSVMEVVDRYDIDAVHFDDYFYPYPVSGLDFPDDAEYAAYGGDFANKAAWRRNNVDTLIRSLSESIKASKPYVKFGISPFGIWRNKGTDPTGSETNGLQSYDALFADTKRWVTEGWIDYIAPQNYWHFGNGPAAYEKVLDWWMQLTRELDVHLYIGQAMYRVTEWSDPLEMANQLLYNRSFADAVDGTMFFSANGVVANPLGITDRLANDLYRYPALPPVMEWLDGDAPDAPASLTAVVHESGPAQLQWEDASGDDRTAYYVIYRQDGLVTPNIADPSLILAKLRKQPGEAQHYTDESTVTGEAYTYAVTAVDRIHQESGASEAALKVLLPDNQLREKIMAKDEASRMIELELSGSWRLANNLIVEQLLDDRVIRRTLGEVMVGADNADFYLNESGEIGRIVLRGETPRDRMRVGIRYNIGGDISDLSHLDHSSISVASDGPFRIIDKIAEEELLIGANETIVVSVVDGQTVVELDGNELYATNSRIYLIPDSAANRLKVTSLTRALGIPQYRGLLEITLSPAEGKLRLINELDIEHYLYGVVPSEMPASFGLEALKAQAVAARTYALTDYLVSRFADYGFHIDDSTLSQVYNNLAENALINSAVDATAGQIMLSGGMLVDARFYSTSGGYGAAKHEVWADTGTGKFPGTPLPYLAGRSYTYDPANPGELLQIDTSDENAINDFYKDLSLTGYDSESLFFRWKVSLSRSELETTISKNLKIRHAEDPQFILTKQPDGSYASRPIPEDGIGELLNLSVASRGAGGNVTELIVEGTTGTYKIIKEFNIRFTIRPNKTDTGSSDNIVAYRAKGGSADYDSSASVLNPSILYSAFFTFDIAANEAGRIERVDFYGGGNGHGAGMSQYGAQMLAGAGWDYTGILDAYYNGMSLVPLDAPVITSIEAASANRLAVGQRDSIVVRGHYSNGDRAVITGGIGYQSSNSLAAAVDDQGSIQAIAPGEAVITVTVGSLLTQHAVTVYRAPVDPPPYNPGPIVIPETPDEDDGEEQEPGENPDNGTGEGPGHNVSLSDIAGHWAEAAIERAVRLGIVSGYPDETFRPQREVTRAEFIVMLMRALPKLTERESALDFDDAGAIPAWAAEAVRIAVAAGIINGYDDNAFRPQQTISRSEITAIIVRVAGLQPLDDAELAFDDADSAPRWAQGYIAAAVEAGLLNGRSPSRFAPNETATRAEAVVVLLNLLRFQDSW